MDTIRLRTIQRPSRVEALLDSFVMSLSHIPESAYPIRDRSELPAVLQRVIIRAEKAQQAWGAWSDGHRNWCFTAEMSLELSRERGTPVLEIRSFGEDGQIQEAGAWACTRDGVWRRTG